MFVMVEIWGGVSPRQLHCLKNSFNQSRQNLRQKSNIQDNKSLFQLKRLFVRVTDVMVVLIHRY